MCNYAKCGGENNTKQCRTCAKTCGGLVETSSFVAFLDLCGWKMFARYVFGVCFGFEWVKTGKNGS